MPQLQYRTNLLIQRHVRAIIEGRLKRDQKTSGTRRLRAATREDFEHAFPIAIEALRKRGLVTKQGVLLTKKGEQEAARKASEPGAAQKAQEYEGYLRSAGIAASAGRGKAETLEVADSVARSVRSLAESARAFEATLRVAVKALKG